MNPLRDWSLRARIRLLALVPATIITLLLTTYFLVERFAAFENELTIRGQTMAEQLAPASEYGLVSGSQEALSALVQVLVREDDVLFVRLYNVDDMLLLERHRDMGRHQEPDPYLRVFSAPVTLQEITIDEISALAAPAAKRDGKQLGRVEIGLVTDGIVARQRMVLLQALLLAMLVLLVTAVFASGTADAVVRIEEARVSAEHASRAKGEFLAMMSHELRTPMNGVMGMLELMQDTPLNAQQREFLDTARRSSEHLLVVIDDILDFSRIEGGRLPIEQIEFDLPVLLAATIDGFAHEAVGRGLDLRLDLDPVLRGLQVTTDPTRLRQVLVNLIGNALKFTEQGGVVVHASGFVDAERVALLVEIEDSGVGIPADRIASMFEPFRQADNSVSRRYGGTGLGLPIAQRLTVMLGGELSVRSVEGEGSCFTVRLDLPARRVSRLPAGTGRDLVTAGSPTRVVDAVLAGRRVLVVEDNPVSQRVAEGMLQGFGMDVDIAVDGAAALAWLERCNYDAVLMDMQMPGMDGLEATRRLRALPADRGGLTPVIALTANALAGERQRCMDAGMNGFIAKPYTRQQLRDVLASVIVADQSAS